MSKLECGTIMGFENDKLILAIVDDRFVEEELTALKRNACTLFYVSKGIVDLFLVSIEDCLETSDVPFCAADYKDDASFLSWLSGTGNIQVRVAYYDPEGNEVAGRNGTLDSTMSQIVRNGFKEQLKKPFDEEAYAASLAKIQAKYEPFELEESALAQCRI